MENQYFQNLIQNYRKAISGKSAEDVRGMPNEAFTSEAYYEEEQKHLFGRSWVFAGTLSDAPKKGDVKPVCVAGRPLLIVREQDDVVRVFFNVCPHRGSQLVECASSDKRTLVCPYHNWTFNLDGRLRGRPHVDGMGNHRSTEQQDRDELGLFPVRFEIWGDWIFVNIDGKAIDFSEFIEPIRNRYEGYPLEGLHRGTVACFEFESNFKLTMENWADNYHLFAIHPTLDQTMANEDRKSMECVGPHVFCKYGFIGDSDSGIEPLVDGVQLPTVKGMSQTFEKSGALGAVFPNIALFASPVCFLFIHFRPLAVNRTEMEVHFYYANEEAALSDEFARARENLEGQWANLNIEDMNICRRTQAGRSCDSFDGGRFIPYWDAAHRSLNRHYADAMVGEGIFAEKASGST